MIKLYGMTGSGNCWKPAVLMKQLGQPFEWTEINTLKGETRTPEFLALNANGRVPLLIVNGRKLAESNAMLCYLADGTDYFPADRWQRAKILEWMFFEQYSHEPYIATVRFWVHFMQKQEEWKDKIAEAMKKGHAALGVMEQQLQKTSFLAGARYSIADIALYAYTHVAHEGGYDLNAYPAINDWMKRLEAQPKFEKMTG
ncbi:glutathione S-transferase family protein [Stenotrophobium rhamnosiphilum]|uniref:Glutathione S-transferase n=1 Tax=Stenotrophobium rhamnosiphilum TaxID=2029166 RepID=A0A2T5MFI8_9GAMM|nr:glutathione S-transferase family protein [Stenotrophobium rhamnosiphilum]PTU31309.1 glutathione S-transferase [Stenotrophobium rhamnosiphilum]